MSRWPTSSRVTRRWWRKKKRTPYYTLIVATLVLLVGRLMVDRIKFLQDFNIPEPVAGGLLAAVIIYILHASTGVSFAFDKGLQDSFILIFFWSIGLSADFSRL